MVCLNKLEWFLVVSFAIKKNFRVKNENHKPNYKRIYSYIWPRSCFLQNSGLTLCVRLLSVHVWHLTFGILQHFQLCWLLILHNLFFVIFKKNNYLHPWSIMFSKKHCAFRWFENIKNSRLTFSVRLLTVHVRSLTFCVLQLSIWVLFYQLICLNFPKKN